MSDINAACSQLVERGVEVSEVETYGGDQGRAVTIPSRPSSYGTGRPVSSPFFKDPDGNSWALQQLPYQGGWATPTASSGGRDKGARDAVVGRAPWADEQ